RGLARSLHDNFGFQLQNVMLVDTDLGTADYRGDRVPPMQKRMIEALETIPGVESVGLADQVPLGDSQPDTNVFIDSTSDLRPSNAAADAIMLKISPEYFHAAGTALLSGRTFTWHDDQNSPRVAVVNRQFARKIFGSITNAMGSYYKMPDGARIQVVGIAEDRKSGPGNVSPHPAIAFRFDLVGGAVGPRSAATGAGHKEHAAATGCRPACFHPNAVPTAGHSAVWSAYGDVVAGCTGRDGRDAVDNRHLWDGCLLGQQAAAGVGNSRRPRRAA